MLKISVVTPSYNHGDCLENTIQSVLSQNYSNLEYIIIDGGSDDNSTDIIRKHENKISYWISEHDKGQYDAINKGFAQSSGEIMAWINSDDVYLPWTFKVVMDVFSQFPDIEWVASLYPMQISTSGEVISCRYHHGYSSKAFYRGEYLPGVNWLSPGFIQQDCVFWRRSLWEKVGGLINTNYQLASDFDLWARFFNYARLYGVQSPLSCFRIHPNQKSEDKKLYFNETKEILKEYNIKPSNLFISAYRKLFIPIIDIIRRNPYFQHHKLIANILYKIMLADSCSICIKDVKISNTWQRISI